MKQLISVTLTILLVSAASVWCAEKPQFGGFAEVSLPLGDFGNVAKTGFGGTVQYHMPFSPNLTGVAAAGYITWGGKDLLDGSFSYNAIPIQAGVRYFFTPQAPLFYLMGDAGIHIVSAKVEFEFGGERFSSSDSETKVSFAPGVGMQFAAGEGLVMDVSLRYQYIDGDLSNLGIRVGALFGK